MLKQIKEKILKAERKEFTTLTWFVPVKPQSLKEKEKEVK